MFNKLMKKIITVATCAMVAASMFAGCVSYDGNNYNDRNPGGYIEDEDDYVKPEKTKAPETEAPATEAPTTKKPEPTTEEPTTKKPTPTEAPTKKPTPTEAPTTKNNVYENYNAGQFFYNNVHMEPRLVYWDKGELVTEYVITNGCNVSVFNINVKEITISNKNGIIASGQFGVMNNAVIAGNGYIIWTFRFPASCVYVQGADLSYIESTYNVAFNY